MEKKLLENHKKYLERINLYRSFGYNLEKERKFILEKAEPLYGNILEVGTGKGYFTVQLAKEGRNFLSIDILDEEQKFAKLNIKYFGFEKLVDFRIENAENLSFNNSSFNIIFSVNTVHHLADVVKVADELMRVAAPKGKIVLSDFTREGLEVVAKIHASEGKEHRVGQTVLSEVADYLETKGFSVQKHRSKFQDVIVAYH
ncbi:MAG: class I SAM-dependent methyltransferase [Candidatus Omnitrophica bacterium]|nr:class I SAM-dependent methyltransferase [Candidatus Omnitrophota bacterium]